jgi:23S rRNA-/tRNA-specific pseudouridylate synthase
VKGRPVVVVASRDAALSEILPRLGERAEVALREGRLFIGRRRAESADDRVAPGDEVTMYPPRRAGLETPRILLRRHGIVAAYKPARLATVSDHRGRAGTLVDAVAERLALSHESIFVTSRLDVGVSGVVLFATDHASHAALTRARSEGRYRRHYVAVAARAPSPELGTWTARIGKDADARKRRIDGRDAVDAKTIYATSKTAAKGALLALEPQTGRTHQLRVHAADAGCPLYGDVTYGGPPRITAENGAVTAIGRIALHAAWVEVPGDGEEILRIEAEPPDDLVAIWTACGGAAADFSPAWQPLSLENQSR